MRTIRPEAVSIISMVAKRPSFLVVIAAILSIASCGTVETRPEFKSVEIAQAVFLQLPESQEINKRIDATQLLVADYGDRSFAFEAQLEIRPGSIKIASVNMWGGTLFSIDFDGKELRTRGSSTGQGPDAQYLLADMLLTYWDAPWIRKRVDGAKLEDTPDGLSRTILRDGEPVIEISYEAADRWTGKTQFTHIERQYVLNIQTVSFSGL